MEILEKFKYLCKERGIKITPQRLAIFSTLTTMKNHPSASEVYEIVKIQNPSISLDTVNRNLIEFCKTGIINSTESSAGVKRFDGNLSPHHHFECLQCNKIIDFNNTKFDEIEVPEEIKNSNKILNKKIVFSGICSECINVM